MLISLIDFYFQSGEFAKSSTSTSLLPLFGSALGSFISGAVAIYIFTRGATRQKKQDKEKEDRVLSDRTKYIAVLLRSASKNISVQATAIDQYMADTKANPYVISPYREALHLDLRSLLALERADVLKVFEKKVIKYDDFIAMYRNLEYANQTFISLKESSRSKTDDIKSFSSQAIQARRKLLNDVATYLHKRKFILKNNEGDALWDSLNQALGTYYSVNNKVPSLQYDLENLVRPLSRNLLAHRDGPDSVQVNEFLLTLREIADLITSVVNINESVAVEYASTVKEIKDTANVELKTLSDSHFSMDTEVTLVDALVS
jgi:hypothetical protein